MKVFTYSFVTPSVLFLIWSAVSYFGFIDKFFLPSPLAVGAALYELFVERAFLSDVVTSIERVFVAFILSSFFALPLGIAMARSKVVSSFVEPIINFVRYLPVPSLVPLIILWIGIGEASKITVLIVGTFFQLTLLVLDDATSVSEELLDSARSLGAPERNVLIAVLLPAMLPSFFDDLRVTLGWCWTYLLIAEIVAAESGIGFVIQNAHRFAQTDIMLAGVLVIGTIGLMSDLTLKWLRQKLFWYSNGES